MTESSSYKFVTLGLRLGLLGALILAGWLVYSQLPHGKLSDDNSRPSVDTTLKIVLHPATQDAHLDIPIEIYPIDIVAVRHEYFAERRAGKRFEDFLKDRMNGRSPVATRLDTQGQATVVIDQGNWWIHALLPGYEDLEWRLPISVSGESVTVELSPQNAYTRTKMF